MWRKLLAEALRDASPSQQMTLSLIVFIGEGDIGEEDIHCAAAFAEQRLEEIIRQQKGIGDTPATLTSITVSGKTTKLNIELE